MYDLNMFYFILFFFPFEKTHDLNVCEHRGLIISLQRKQNCKDIRIRLD